MSEVGVIKVSNDKNLLIEVEDLTDDEQDLLKSIAKPSDSDRPNSRAPGAEPVSTFSDMAGALSLLRDNIEVLTAQVNQALEKNKPQEWSLEFSVGFKGKSNPIPFIVGGEADAALKIKATWKDKE